MGTGVMLMIVIFALFCCGMALYVVVADRNWQPSSRRLEDPLAGMSADALEVLRRAQR